MNKKIIRADLILLLVAFIWGFAFSAQRSVVDKIGPFTFNAIRFFMGALVLIPIILIFGKKNKRLRRTAAKEAPSSLISKLIPPAIIGFCLFAASSLQQVGLFWTTAGKSGFITGLYVVFVPIFGIFLHRKTGISTCIGAFFTFCGLFFVAGIGELVISSIKSGTVDASTVNLGDLLTVISAIFWTFQVLFIDHYLKDYEPLKLALGQVVVCSSLSLVCALIGISRFIGMHGGPELIDSGFKISSLIEIAPSILYVGIASVGIANTLQVVAQTDAPPAHAAILMSLETVFAAIGGFLVLGERPAHAAMFGFALMLVGMLATQWDVVMGRGVHKN